MVDVSELDPIIHDRFRRNQPHSHKKDTKKPEEEKRPIVTKNLNNRKNDLSAVRNGTQLGNTAGWAIAIFDRDLLNSETLIERMQCHVGFDLKTFDQNRIVLHEGAAESSIATGDIDEMCPEQKINSPL